MVERISVTILTKNSQTYIGRCLDALHPFEEIIVLDNGSSDDTLSIVARYPNVTLVEHPFIGFGPLKNLAIDHARNDWILSIDSDEIAKAELIDEISKLDLSDAKTIYTIPRDNYYNGRLIRCCGWYPDQVMRLFNRTHTRFGNQMVHESLVLHPNTSKKALLHALNHFSYNNAEELIAKMQKYSTLYAEQNTKRSTPAKAFFRALFAFVKNYLFQKGFLYGYEGLLISVTNANNVFYKYIKLYEKQNRKHKHA